MHEWAARTDKEIKHKLFQTLGWISTSVEYKESLRLKILEE